MIKNLLAREHVPAAAAAFARCQTAGMHRVSSLTRRFSFKQNKKEVFYPQQRLRFVNGRLLVAEARFRGFYVFSSCAMVGLSVILYWSAKKLYNYQNRGIVGFIFYSGVTIAAVLLIRSCNASMSELITKMWLNKTGKSVIVKTASPFSRSREIDINCISRPETLPIEYAMTTKALIGFPVVINGEYYMLPKDTIRHEQDIFAAVFSGMDVEVAESPDEIVIE
jgi:hypothetical protein